MAVLIYKKLPVEVECVKWTGDNIADVCDFCPDADMNNGNLIIKTLEGVMVALEGDFIIKGIEGEFWACRSDIFEKTYSLIRVKDKDE